MYCIQDQVQGTPQTLVAAANIIEYSAAFFFTWNNDHQFDIHLAYNLNNTISYKHCEFYPSIAYWHFYAVNTPEYLSLSSGDAQLYRKTPDITLRNASNNPANGYVHMQPVVTYQGQQVVRIIVPNGNGIDGYDYVTTYNYPIIIKERRADGSWNSNSYSYNSTTPQQNPGIDGSKTKDSYLVNYSQNDNTFFQRVPKWNGLSGYFSTITSFSGKDAKFVKSGLVDASSSAQYLMELTSTGNVNTLVKQPFSITNIPQSGTDESFDGVTGVVVVDNLQYSFNLNSVMINNNLIDFGFNIDTTLNNTKDVNNIMHSNNFRLSENDTLVLGRDGYYLPSDSAGSFTGIEYWVDLKHTNGELFQNLVHDTLHVNDTIHLEYLDGYVITQIPGGADSFYVNLRIDTIHVGIAAGGGLGGDGGAGGSGGLGKPGQMKKVFWHDGRKENVNATVPNVFNLYQNFPNPFNPVTVIKYDLPKDVNVTIKVYNLLGQEVTRLVNNEFKKAGRYEINWNANNCATGVYIYRITAGDYVKSRKMVLIK